MRVLLGLTGLIVCLRHMAESLIVMGYNMQPRIWVDATGEITMGQTRFV